MSKELSVIEQSTELEVVTSGPVVAIQYPATVTFSEDEPSAIELHEKYAHLRQIDPDDKVKYKELVAAIADIRTRRTDVAKEEKVIKDPLNKFRDVVIKTSKAVRKILGSTEDTLKDEKQRIDDIREERKLAQRKLWQDNLDSLRAMSSGLQQMSREDLDLLSESLHDFDFDTLDFGEYIEQAKATIDLTISATNERIAFLVEQQRLADEKAAFDKKQIEEAAERKRLDDERIKREASEKKMRDDEKAEADRKQAETDAENQRLRDQVAAMEKANEPEPEMTIVSQGDITMVEESLCGDKPEWPVAGHEVIGNDSNGSQQERDQSPEQIDRENDHDALSTWAHDISEVIEAAPKGIVDAKAAKAVEQVSDQLESIHEYLTSNAYNLMGE